MTLTAEKKLCWNCDGAIDLDSCRCCYCGAEVAADDEFAPPYQVESEATEVPAPPYAQGRSSPANATVSDREWEDALSPEAQEAVISESREELQTSILPMALLLFGAVFSLFGLVLYLYSDKPTLVLEWNTSAWPFYLCPAAAALYYGWKEL